MVIPFVLQFSCRLPVSVCGTGTSISTLAAFLASVNSSASLLVFAPCHHPALRHAYFTTCLPHDLAPAFHPRSPTILLCPCFELLRWYWNIYQLSIIYAFRPQLRSRLTLGGRTFPSRYSCRHSLLYAVHRPFRYGFCPHTLLLYQLYYYNS